VELGRNVSVGVGGDVGLSLSKNIKIEPNIC
jgi:hypothetical protein